MTTKLSTRTTAPDSPSNEHERLGTLLQIGEAFSSTLNAKAAIHEVLETLARRHAIARSLVVLVDDDGRQLHVEAAHGLNRPSHHIQYTVGEGVIGKVVETGKCGDRAARQQGAGPHLPQIPRDEGAGDESSFVCVPSGSTGALVGALGVNLKFKADRNYDRSEGSSAWRRR